MSETRTPAEGELGRGGMADDDGKLKPRSFATERPRNQAPRSLARYEAEVAFAKLQRKYKVERKRTRKMAGVWSDGLAAHAKDKAVRR